MYDNKMGDEQKTKQLSTPRPTAPLNLTSLTVWHGTQILQNEDLLLDALSVGCGDDIFFVSSQRLDVGCSDFTLRRFRFRKNFENEPLRETTNTLQLTPVGLDALPIVSLVSIQDRYVVMFGKDQTKFNAIIVFDNRESMWLNPFDKRIPPPLPGKIEAVTVMSHIMWSEDVVIIAVTSQNGVITIWTYAWDKHKTLATPPAGQFHTGQWNRLVGIDYQFTNDSSFTFEGPYSNSYHQELDLLVEYAEQVDKKQVFKLCSMDPHHHHKHFHRKSESISQQTMFSVLS